MFCTECGKELRPGNRFCIYCGAPISEDLLNEQEISEDIPADIPDGDKTEILIEESLSGPTLPGSDMSGSLKYEKKSDGTLLLGFEPGEQDNTDDYREKPLSPAGNRKRILKYRDHIIDESRIKGEIYVPQNRKKSGTSAVIKVLIVLVILLILAAVGLGAYYYIDSQPHEKALTAPEIVTEEESK